MPLTGIDVPFHSSYLQPGVSSFRRHLLEKIPRDAVRLDRLLGKYVPNLTATPFDITRAYFEAVWKLTGSTVVGDVVDRVSFFHSFIHTLIHSYSYSFIHSFTFHRTHPAKRFAVG